MNSLSAMGILLFFTVLGVILFGSIIFFLEAGTFEVNQEYPEGAFLRWNVLRTDREESPFSSILVSCYWAMVTFTTVGYGDLVPTSPFGRFVALVLMYSGILVLALPISVIGANFQREYERLEGYEDDDEDDGELPAVNVFDAHVDSEEDEEGEEEEEGTKKLPSSGVGRGVGKKTLLRGNSSAGSPRCRRDQQQVGDRRKKPINRGRSNTLTSTVGDEVAEAVAPVTEQLKLLTSTCVVLMERIDQLQKQQNQMMKTVAPDEYIEESADDEDKDVKSEIDDSNRALLKDDQVPVKGVELSSRVVSG